jgi:hypothetical protein
MSCSNESSVPGMTQTAVFASLGEAKPRVHVPSPPPAPPHKGMRIVRDAAGRVSHAVPIE